MTKRSKVQLYEQIRRVHEGEQLSIRALARRFGVHRRDVRAALDSAVPAPRKVPERPAPKMDEFKSVIDAWLEADRSLPRKQRHTARRVWQRLVDEKWSPEKIANRLRKDHPGDPEWWVSHELIYQAIFVHAKRELGKELAACLRTMRDRRKPHSRATAAKVSKIPNMVNIKERPEEVLERLVPGDWEGDLIIGKDGLSAVATLVERTTRFGKLVRVESKKADHVAEQLSKAASELPNDLMRSLTWDQGTEMAAHEPSASTLA